MFEERILFLSPAVNLTLIQRAEEIFRIQYALSKCIQKNEWIINNKVIINVNNKEDTISAFLKNFKKEIKHNTTLKNIEDNFVDNVASGLLFYYLKYNDNSLIFSYSLGCNSEISQFNEVLIYNYKILINMLGFAVFKSLIKNMAALLDATALEVPEELAKELKEILGSSVDVQIINSTL